MLLSIEQANARIRHGGPLIIAGSPSALRSLTPGNWIGGSIPYFITAEGGCCDRRRVFVEEIKLPVTRWSIQAYTPCALSGIATDAYANGFSYLIIPANSRAHLEYAMHAPTYPAIYLQPTIGWISGLHLDDLGREAPIVVDGRQSRVISDEAIVLHVELPPQHEVMVHTINLFRPGSGETLRFTETGFSARQAFVDGELVDLARHIRERNWDVSLPLVADYAGANVNVSIKAVDAAAGEVSFYAPVFAEVEYRQAAPIASYVDAFTAAVPTGIEPVVSCNCILNYLYGKLEHQRTGSFTGPVTFGEIAHQLVNQTLVYLAENRPAA